MSIIDDLLDESKGQQDGESTFTFTTELTGRVWTAKKLVSSDEWEQALKEAKRLQSLTKANSPASYHDMLPISPSTARGIAFMDASLVSPRLATLEALTLAKKRGVYFIQVSTELQSHLMGAKVTAENEAIDKMGETSSETVDDETSSKSPLASGTATPMS